MNNLKDTFDPVVQTSLCFQPNKCAIKELMSNPLLNFLNVVFHRQSDFPILQASVDVFIIKNVLNPMCDLPEKEFCLHNSLLSGIHRNTRHSKRTGLLFRQNLKNPNFQIMSSYLPQRSKAGAVFT
jgi:hypothetical protein